MNLEIKKSNIHGNGLFSLTPIQKNIKICDYIGEEMSYTDFLSKYGNYKKNCLNTYRMRRINKIIVAKEEPYKTQNLVNYINESDNPNCILKKRALYSLQDINKNEELTIKYPNDYYREWKV
jgi:SET domain-containing protein